MEKEITSTDYPLPPLELLDEYIPESYVLEKEAANGHRPVLRIRSVLCDDEFRNNRAGLPVAIGRTFDGKVKVLDLSKAPNLLISGATKQGKTVAINAVVASLLYSKLPSELKFVFIDPKGYEYSAYNRIKDSYLAMAPGEESVVKTLSQTENVLASLCREMERRGGLLRNASAANISAYKTSALVTLPYIVIVIDEYADLAIPVHRDRKSRSMSHNISESVLSLAQNGSAVGIHIILSTQRPSKKVITDSIRVTFPTRISVRTVTRSDSRTIIGTSGAEKLLGRGDMILQTGVETIRLHGAYISLDEIDRLTSYVESHTVSRSPYYLPELDLVSAQG